MQDKNGLNWTYLYSTMIQQDALFITMLLSQANIEWIAENEEILTVNPSWHMWAPIYILVPYNKLPQAKIKIKSFITKEKMDHETQNQACNVLKLGIFFCWIQNIAYVAAVILWYLKRAEKTQLPCETTIDKPLCEYTSIEATSLSTAGICCFFCCIYFITYTHARYPNFSDIVAVYIWTIWFVFWSAFFVISQKRYKDRRNISGE